tara:strand:+ start:65 stop:280 length:216 start_codon:yes stop_codon:yes gene_type:complete
MRIILFNKQKGEEIGELNLQFLPRKTEYIFYDKKEYIVLNVIHYKSYIVLDVTENKTTIIKNFSEPTIHQY